MRCRAAALTCCMWAGAAAGVVLWGTPVRAADDLPPPLVSAPGPDAAAAPAPAAAAPARTAEAPPAATAGEAPAQPKPEPTARIEQKHVGRRVSEVVVTPAGFTYHYTMTHLDDQEAPRTPLQPHQELSVPNLIRIDF
jgi:hypothetical protein